MRGFQSYGSIGISLGDGGSSREENKPSSISNLLSFPFFWKSFFIFCGSLLPFGDFRLEKGFSPPRASFPLMSLSKLSGKKQVRLARRFNTLLCYFNAFSDKLKEIFFLQTFSLSWGLTPLTLAWTLRASLAVSSGSRAFSCGQYPAAAAAARPPPPGLTAKEPAVGLSAPVSMRKVVDLPAPFRPSQPKHCRGKNDKIWQKWFIDQERIS